MNIDFNNIRPLRLLVELADEPIATKSKGGVHIVIPEHNPEAEYFTENYCRAVADFKWIKKNDIVLVGYNEIRKCSGVHAKSQSTMFKENGKTFMFVDDTQVYMAIRDGEIVSAPNRAVVLPIYAEEKESVITGISFAEKKTNIYKVVAVGNIVDDPTEKESKFIPEVGEVIVGQKHGTTIAGRPIEAPMKAHLDKPYWTIRFSQIMCHQKDLNEIQA